LTVDSKLLERTAVAGEGRPPQHAEKGCELSPHRCRTVLERLIDDAEEAAQSGGIELGRLGHDTGREHLEEFSLFLG